MARSRRPKTAATAPRSQPRDSSSSGRLGIIAVAAIVIVLAAGGWWLMRPQPAGPVILISIDTLRADHLAAYGYTKGRTPNIDALVRDSVVFDRAYAHAPQTLPSHTSILTGQLPFEHGVRDNIGFSVKPDATTLASLFKTKGYGAGGFVSAYVLRPETGIGRGFDVYNADLPVGGLDRPIAQVTRPAPDTARAALAWLSTHVDPKLFLFVHFYEPHRPYEPPERFKDLLPYDGEIAAADESVGTILAELRRRDWYDSATIVLVADHGEGLGDHGEEEHGLFLYEPTIHVPFIIKTPYQKSAGTHISAPVQHIDLLPTFAKIAGFAVPKGLRGRSLFELWHSGTIEPQGIYSEAMMPRYHFGWSELTSLTDERYKFIRAPKSELYDLERDRAETQNLLSERTQVASAMRNGLESLIAGRGVDAPASNVSNEDRQRLAALGYIGSASVGAETSGLTLPDPKDKADINHAFVLAARSIGSMDFMDAAARLKWITDREPGMTDAWNQYAQVLIRLGRDADALNAYKQMLQQRPDQPSVLLDAATVLMRLRRYDEAKAHALAAVSGEPITAHQMLAKIELAQGHTDAALKEAAAAEAADPTLPMTDFIHGVILHTAAQKDPAKYAEALPYFQRASEKIKTRIVQLNDLHYYLGDCLAQVGRLEEAEQAFQQEIKLFPNLIRARTGLAMLYEAAGNTQGTERVVNGMLNASPTPSTYASAAELWRVLGHPDRAAAVAAAGKARFGR
jgi:arylsulfatase A-like enzyme/tetratricopeptide (TPR) repeat protein